MGKEINGNDVSQICSVIKNDIDSKDTKTRSIDGDTIIIKKIPFTKDDLLHISKSIVTSTDETGNKGKMSVNGRLITSYFKNKMKSTGENHDLNDNFVVTSTRMLKGGIPLFENAFRISIYPHANYNLTKRLISSIKKASRQIPENEAGVVHIAIPNSIGNEMGVAPL